MINIRVLLIIRVLIILKHFRNLDFECYREREREIFKKSGSQLWFLEFLKFLNFFELLRDLKNNYYNYFDKE